MKKKDSKYLFIFVATAMVSAFVKCIIITRRSHMDATVEKTSSKHPRQTAVFVFPIRHFKIYLYIYIERDLFRYIKWTHKMKFRNVLIHAFQDA